MRHPAVLLVLFLLAGNNGDSASALAASSSGWTIAYSPGMPSEMPTKDGNYYFDFPKMDGVHYVYQRAPAVGVGQTVTMVFTIEGSGTFIPTEGTASARVRLFLQERGDTLTAAEPHKRWWSTAFAELKPGTFALTAVIAPELWSSVLGKNGGEIPGEFYNAISNLANIGFTFGGTFAGHGVYVIGGNARFVLKEFRVISPDADAAEREKLAEESRKHQRAFAQCSRNVATAS
jgi:hypothetical protein